MKMMNLTKDFILSHPFIVEYENEGSKLYFERSVYKKQQEFSMPNETSPLSVLQSKIPRPSKSYHIILEDVKEKGLPQIP